jgi:hypothetical protein
LGAIVITVLLMILLRVLISCGNCHRKAGDFVGSLYVISLALLYVLAMLYIVKPFLKRIGDLYSTKDNIGKPVIYSFVTYYFIYATEVIGIHALWRFYDGAIMPDITKFRMILSKRRMFL